MTNINEEYITTGIDKFMRILYEKKRVEISQIAKEMNVPEETIEYWAYILENQGLVKITYTLASIYIEWISG
ncbi:MAG: hypothetical protein NZ903_02685 [Candidatus Micrarchaeota archaeon]|nr:hypothetical protein [Candidatus Micrarchaeota archaeon]MCX8169750.1 hypothetical protein [Candidatus Methanomethyliaceae archaeon]